MKLAIIGAGQVGGQAAFACAQGRLVSTITLIDPQPGLARGKALDIHQSLALADTSVTLTGDERLDAMSGADVVVIAAGRARRPGMRRIDLLRQNADIVANIAERAARLAPDSRIIVVTNPVNPLAGLVQQSAGFPPRRVFGMGGVLDNARLRAGLAVATRTPVASVESLVVGDHGEHMVAVLGECRIRGVPVERVLDRTSIDAVVEATRHAGTEIVNLLGNGSAYFAPGMAVAAVVRSIVRDEQQVLCCSTQAEGQYGLSGAYVGLPVAIGQRGVETVLTPELTAAERAGLEDAWEFILGQCQQATVG